MLTHVVMWKFTDTETGSKAQHMDYVKTHLEALIDTVPVLKSIRFYPNEVVCDRNFDAMLVVKVANEDDLNAYKLHPAHQAVAGYVKDVTVNRAAVDLTTAD